MTITEADRNTLLQYRIQQAHDTIEDVRLLLEHDRLRLAVNRIYYGMFYILTALALLFQFKTSKHQGLIGWFSKNFIKDNKIDRKYGEIIHKAFKSRTDSDYGDFINYEKADVLKMFAEMQDFISTIEKYIDGLNT